MDEKVKETRKCENCWCEFWITDWDKEFLEKFWPTFNWKKYTIPFPKFCPDCRMQRRLAFRNERTLYKRKCDISWKTIISIYSPEKDYKIFNTKDRWTDKRDPLSYWVDFDFNKPFFEQFNELMKKVPRPWLYRENTENSDYWNDIWPIKNSYLVFNWAHAENLLYVDAFFIANNCMDCDWIVKNTSYSYDSFKLDNCYKCISCYYCANSSECYFCYDCHWCKNCFWCVNLVNQEYCIYNEKVWKEKYNEYIKSIDLWSYEQYQQQRNKFFEFKMTQPHQPKRIINCENCIWDNVSDSKDSNFVFDCFNLDNCKNVWNWWGSYLVDTYNVWNDWDYSYDSLASYNVNNLFFSSNCEWCNHFYYCDNCGSWDHLFGCVWLSNQSYCIFNKQYSKQEFETLSQKIIEHMIKTWERWEFFPTTISTFWYNETLANEFFPLSEQEAKSKWYKRQEKYYPVNVPEWTKTIKSSEIPDNIKDVEDSILDKAIICNKSNKPFRIIKAELEFCRKHWLPLARNHPDQRHNERIWIRNDKKLYERSCSKCWAKTTSTYSPNRKEIVYCENCYNKLVFE